MHRRDFLIALPVLIAARPSPGRAHSIGVAYGDAATTSAHRGLRFGMAEAKRTTQLLKRELPWHERTGADALVQLTRARADLIIALGDVGTAPAGAPPVLRVPLTEADASSCGGDEWHVAPSPEQRAAAVEAYRANSPPLVPLRALAWHPALEKYGAAQLSERYRAASAGVPMDEGAWLGWIAAKIAVEASLRGAPAQQLRAAGFAVDGHKGAPLRFDPLTRRLGQPLYIIDPRRAADPPLAEITPGPSPAACVVR